MTRLTLNREFAVRHLGVALLMLGLSGWFAYDGFVAYPEHDDEWFERQHLRKDAATRRQREFMVLALVAAVVIAGHVGAVAKFDFSYDDDGFVCGGVRRRFADVKSVDWSKWEKKGIVKVDGIVLDAWHHAGVRGVADILKSLEGRGGDSEQKGSTCQGTTEKKC